mmetsp:Transcript_17120/g.24743  ORF Transcript_17120/g.24743 Transcript_17120/m.24743 type:complete len:341 (+) Transcript_17120:147-1169(+)
MWKNYDAFAKPRDDLRSKSASGGIITLVASVSAGILFLAQLFLYIKGGTRHSLHLATSHWSPVHRLNDFNLSKKYKIPFRMHVSFPNIACRDLDLKHDGISSIENRFSSIHGRKHTKISKRPMTPKEYRMASSSSNVNNQRLETKTCSVEAEYDVAKVGGTVSIGLTQKAWQQASTYLMMGIGFGQRRPGNTGGTTGFNMTHYIHSVSFGENFPLTENPFAGKLHLHDNDAGGIALSQMSVKLVPTKYSTMFGSRDTYQLSVTDHVVGPETMATQGSRFMPGLGLSYDFTPLMVHHVQSRDNLLVFLSSLLSIVGGVFVTVSMVSSVVVHSAAAVAKKID